VRLAPRRTTAILLALVIAVGALGAAADASAACVYPSAYPGDNAAKATIAAWMAGGASDAGLPGELPVMAALVDSGLVNLNYGDADNVGYFQMRMSIWNSGDYSGFPDHPTLQLQWFIDQAQKVRQQAIAAGSTHFGEDPSTWGEWVADVQRPAAQYRGRYQLRLNDARSLIASGCAAPDPDSPQPAPSDPSSPPAQEPDMQLIPDSFLPRLVVQARRYQDAAKSGALSVNAACANERCLVRSAASIAVPGRGVFRVSVAPLQIGAGQAKTFRLELTTRVRKLVAKSLRKRACPLAAVRVIGANAGGYRNSVSRTVVLARSARVCS
jgi:hypothetical protein